MNGMTAEALIKIVAMTVVMTALEIGILMRNKDKPAVRMAAANGKTSATRIAAAINGQVLLVLLTKKQKN